MTGPAVYDHVRPVDDRHRDGIYRVVGVDDGSVTLLHVGEPDGQRVHSGELLRVDRDDFESFTAAENPQGNRSLGSAVASKIAVTGWSVRVFASQLIAHPLASALLALVVLAGAIGDRWLSLPELLLDALVVLGVVGLTYVGSGWIDRR